MGFKARVTADARYSLTSTLLHAAAMFAGRAREFEATTSSRTLTGDILDEHQGLVLAAVMQAVAALEAEIYEVIVHGPGHHLGSNYIDIDIRDSLKATLIAKNGRPKDPTLVGYSKVLRLLNKPPLSAAQRNGAATLLVDLRNELTHYKSKWGAEMDAEFLARLERLNLARPSFIEATENRFPRRYLSTACGAWAVETALEFLLAFYELLGLSPPISRVESKVRTLIAVCRAK